VDEKRALNGTRLSAKPEDLKALVVTRNMLSAADVDYKFGMLC
jgi:hypothetical protein